MHQPDTHPLSQEWDSVSLVVENKYLPFEKEARKRLSILKEVSLYLFVNKDVNICFAHA